MDILQLAFSLVRCSGPWPGTSLTAELGATSGFVIPIGPLVVAWLFGGR